MLDLVPIADTLTFVEGVATGAFATVLGAFVYVNRTKIANFFKRAEATAATEVNTIRQALAGFEEKVIAGFNHVSSATKALQADTAAIKGTVSTFHDRLTALESAVFGTAPANPAPAPAAPAAPATAQLQGTLTPAPATPATPA